MLYLGPISMMSDLSVRYVPLQKQIVCNFYVIYFNASMI